MIEIKSLCQYQDPDGKHHLQYVCQEEANHSGYCFWHDKGVEKSGDDIKYRLEKHAKNGGMLRGVILSNANLAKVDLVNHHKKNGYDFSYADFYHANLQSAHLFNINLNNASIMKANLRDANLNCANLSNTNMLGVKWAGSKIVNVHLGKAISQEKLAREYTALGNNEDSIDYFKQAEEIYRDLRTHAEHEGVFTLSGYFIRKELTMRRLQLPRHSMSRFLSKLVDVFCGYGEQPWRIVGLSLGIIFLCAFAYAFTGLSFNDTFFAMSTSLSFNENIAIFQSSLYFSVVTFTTLGYGDLTPVGISRAIAAIEAFTGSFTIALFVVVFVKKMTR